MIEITTALNYITVAEPSKSVIKAIIKVFSNINNDTCLPHFQSGPRITRAPTPSIINLVALDELDDPGKLGSILKQFFQLLWKLHEK